MSLLFNPKKNLSRTQVTDPFFSRFDDLVNNLWSVTPNPISNLIDENQAIFSPQIEVHRSENDISVNAELPGLTSDDIHLHLEDNTLVIEGEKKMETKKEEEGKYYSERRYGHFRRSIPMPFKVDEEKVSANFEKGVLSIELQKAKEAKENTRKIPIRS